MLVCSASTKDPSRSGRLSLTASSIAQRTLSINASGTADAVKVVVPIDLQRVGAGSSEFISNLQAVVERSVLPIDSVRVVVEGQSSSTLSALVSVDSAMGISAPLWTASKEFSAAIPNKRVGSYAGTDGCSMFALARYLPENDAAFACLDGFLCKLNNLLVVTLKGPQLQAPIGIAASASRVYVHGPGNTLSTYDWDLTQLSVQSPSWLDTTWELSVSAGGQPIFFKSRSNFIDLKTLENTVVSYTTNRAINNVIINVCYDPCTSAHYILIETHLLKLQASTLTYIGIVPLSNDRIAIAPALLLSNDARSVVARYSNETRFSNGKWCVKDIAQNPHIDISTDDHSELCVLIDPDVCGPSKPRTQISSARRGWAEVDGVVRTEVVSPTGATAPWAPTVTAIGANMVRVIAQSDEICIKTRFGNPINLVAGRAADISVGRGTRRVHARRVGPKTFANISHGQIVTNPHSGYVLTTLHEYIALPSSSVARSLAKSSDAFQSIFAPNGRIASTTSAGLVLSDSFSGVRINVNLPVNSTYQRVLLATNTLVYYSRIASDGTARVGSWNTTTGQLSTEIQTSLLCRTADFLDTGRTYLLCDMKYANLAESDRMHAAWTVVSLSSFEGSPTVNREYNSLPRLLAHANLTLAPRSRAAICTHSIVGAKAGVTWASVWSVPKSVSSSHVNDYHSLALTARAWFTCENFANAGSPWMNKVPTDVAQTRAGDITSPIPCERENELGYVYSNAAHVHTGLVFNNTFTVVLVGKGTFGAATSSAVSISSSGVSSHGYAFVPSVTPLANGFYIAVVKAASARINGVDCAPASSLAIEMLQTSNNSWQLSSIATPWSIAELIAFDFELSTNQIALLENVLVSKYRDARGFTWSSAMNASVDYTVATARPQPHIFYQEHMTLAHRSKYEQVVFATDAPSHSVVLNAQTLSQAFVLSSSGKVLDADADDGLLVLSNGSLSLVQASASAETSSADIVATDAHQTWFTNTNGSANLSLVDTYESAYALRFDTALPLAAAPSTSVQPSDLFEAANAMASAQPPSAPSSLMYSQYEHFESLVAKPKYGTYQASVYSKDLRRLPASLQFSMRNLDAGQVPQRELSSKTTGALSLSEALTRTADGVTWSKFRIKPAVKVVEEWSGASMILVAEPYAVDDTITVNGTLHVPKTPITLPTTAGVVTVESRKSRIPKDEYAQLIWTGTESNVRVYSESAQYLGNANITAAHGSIVQITPLPSHSNVICEGHVLSATGVAPCTLTLSGNVSVHVDVYAANTQFYVAHFTDQTGMTLGEMFGYGTNTANSWQFDVASPDWQYVNNTLVARVPSSSVPWYAYHIEPLVTELELEAVGGVSKGFGYDIGSFNGSGDRWFVLTTQWKSADFGKPLRINARYASPARVLRSSGNTVVVDWTVGESIRVSVAGAKARTPFAYGAGATAAAGTSLLPLESSISKVCGNLRGAPQGVANITISSTRTPTSKGVVDLSGSRLTSSTAVRSTLHAATVPLFSNSVICQSPMLYLHDSYAQTRYVSTHESGSTDIPLSGFALHMELRISTSKALCTCLELGSYIRLKIGYSSNNTRMQLQASWINGSVAVINVPLLTDDSLTYKIDLYIQPDTNGTSCILQSSLNQIRAEGISSPVGLNIQIVTLAHADISIGSSATGTTDFVTSGLRDLQFYYVESLDEWNSRTSVIFAKSVGVPDPIASQPLMTLPSFQQPINRMNCTKLRVAGLFYSQSVSSLTGVHRVRLLGAAPAPGTIMKAVGQAKIPTISQTLPIVTMCMPGEVAFGVYYKYDREMNTHLVAAVGEGGILLAPNTSVCAGHLLKCGANGWAVPQSDDFVRSNTVAKSTTTVTSGNVPLLIAVTYST